jgi:transcriptional regulator with XRE-family HTH domain
MNSTDKKISRWLKSNRRSQKMDIQKFSELSGISTAHISRIENGKSRITIDILVRMAHALEYIASDVLKSMGVMVGQSLRSDIKTNKELGSLLKEFRVGLDLSQARLGEAIGVTQSAIYRYEEGMTEKLFLDNVLSLDEFFEKRGELIRLALNVAEVKYDNCRLVE